MGEIDLEEGVPDGEERWRDEGGSGESTHFHAHGWRPDPVVPVAATAESVHEDMPGASTVAPLRAEDSSGLPEGAAEG